MNTETNWTQGVCSRVSLYINRGLNGGDCPGPGAIGECALVYVKTNDSSLREATFAAEVYLVGKRAADFKPATLALWIETAGGKEPVISHVLHDPLNGTRDGICPDGAHHWRAQFTVVR